MKGEVNPKARFKNRTWGTLPVHTVSEAYLPGPPALKPDLDDSKGRRAPPTPLCATGFAT